jgi:hypothetical protein
MILEVSIHMTGGLEMDKPAQDSFYLTTKDRSTVLA